ncbi:hypothetical protein, partial [Prevotella brunnea]|uniref:hypothetical protein n=1 Tax=Prevotella brunnea TaxID=2508867 RepID=UPI00283A9ED0
YCWLFFSSPRDADNLSLRFENVCISRRGLLFYCTSFWNLQSVMEANLLFFCLSRSKFVKKLPQQLAKAKPLPSKS